MAAPKSSFVVYSTAGKYDVIPASAQAILGDYVEDGANHGKRVYRRARGDGAKGLPEVVLFFWDMRDGKDLSGWWFGDKIGGGQVWARNQTMSAVPPSKGWRCPVDGPVQPHIACMPKVRAKMEESDDPAGLGGALKRAGDGSELEPAVKRRQQMQVLVLTSNNGDDDSKEVQTLLGQYVQQGVNHGKKTFMKKAGDGAEAVWLYYWDNRDGREHSGWWLGSSVGGEEVFARAEQHSAMPPIKGWRIPHDGGRAEVSLMLKGHEEDAEMPEEERLQKVKDLVSSLESKVDKAVETSQGVVDGEGDIFEEGVRAVYQLLQARVEDLEDAKASTARHSKAAKKQKASNETEAELGLLDERLDSAMGKAMKEAARALELLTKCELQGAEERDAKAMEDALPQAMELVAQAEMTVEAATTDEAAMKARDLVQAAGRHVGKMLDAANSFAPEAQKLALAEFTSLRDRCGAAERRLALWEGSGLNGPDVIVDDAEADEAAPEAAEAAAGEAEGAEDGEAEAAGEDAAASGEELLQQMTVKVAEVEGGAKQALETATVVLKDGSDINGVKLCLDLLTEHYEAVRKAQQTLAQEAAALDKMDVAPATEEAMRALGPRLQVVRAHITQELGLAKRQVAKSQRQAREVRDLQAAEFALPMAMEAVEQAEEAVETVALEAGDPEWRRKQIETALQFGDEYGDEIQKSMEETQVAAESAQDAINAARTRLDAQIKAARLLPAEEQKATFAEMAPVRKRLIDAQKKLNPYKHVRAEFEQQLKAKGELESLSSKVAAVEADIEGVSSALEGAASNEEDMKSVEATIQPIHVALAKVLKLLEQKSKGITGALQERLAHIRERSVAARAKLEELKVRAREERSELVGQSLAQQARKEVQRLEAWFAKIKEAEAPWAEGVEVLPEAKAAPALAACEAIVKEALPAVQATKTLVLERLVEARQLPEGLLQLNTTEELQCLQANVDAVSLKVTQLKIDTFARKTKMQMAEVVAAVAKAEKEAGKIVEAAAPFAKDDLEKAPAKTLKEVGAKVLKCAGGLTKVCEAAREAVAAKQRDPRNRMSPSFNTQLSKLEARLQSVEGTLQGLCRAAREAEGNKKILQEQAKEVARLGKVVSDVENLALPLGDEQPSEQAEESTAMSVRDAQEALDTWSKAAGTLADNPHGSMKLAMERLLEQGRAMQARLNDAKSMIREQNERAFCRIFVREVRAEVKKAVAVMAKTEEAEGPFLKGIEVLSPGQSAETIAACEAAAAKAEAALGEVRSFVAARHAEASAYQREDFASKASVEELGNHLSHLDKLAAKLGQFQSDTASRKRVASEHQDGPAAKVARTGASK